MSHSGKQWSTQRYSIQEANPSFNHKWVHHSWKSKSAVYLYIDDAWCFDYMAKIAGFRSGGNGLSLYRVTNWSVKSLPNTKYFGNWKSYYKQLLFEWSHLRIVHVLFKGCSNVICYNQLVQHNKQYLHRKVLFNSFQLNSYTQEFHSETQKSEPPCTS